MTNYRGCRVPHTIASAIALCWATTGTAQEAEPPQQTQFEPEEIIVTAQKREEALSDVPISIAVFDDRSIERNNIKELDDFAILTPGLAINQSGAPADVAVTIRGIGALGGDQNTFGYYVDGFEVSAADAGNVANNLTDVQRIEVLRGPQGTTFGRNVVAGAISVTSVPPNYEFGGSAAAEVFSYGGRELRGVVNVPLADGKAAARVSGFYRGNDGYIRNVGPSGGRSGFDQFGFRGALRLQPSDRLTIDAAVSYEDYRQGIANSIPDGIVIGQFITLREIIDAGLGRVPRGTLPAGPNQYFPDQNNRVALDADELYRRNTFLATLRADYDFGPISLVSVSGYTRNPSSTYYWTAPEAATASPAPNCASNRTGTTALTGLQAAIRPASRPMAHSRTAQARRWS
jgi:iron complex outermembrane recepter protein